MASGPDGTVRALGLAAFDFDGTVTPRDTFVGFLRYVAGPAAVARAAASSTPLLAGRRAEGARRDGVKSHLIRQTLTGRTEDDLRAAGQTYAARVARLVRPALRQRMQEHTSSSHAVIIVSASLELYLHPLAPDLGLDAVLATRLEVGPDGRLTGALEGLNCRGTEKVRRIRTWAGSVGLDLGRLPMWAYGDSRGDAHMLSMASVPARLRRGRRPGRLQPLTVPPGVSGVRIDP